MKDLIYIYDKASPYARHELGEIQSDFNLSFVVDGTKDSAKVEVFNFSEVEVEPYSIVKHKSTNTWWVVSHDKVERLPNENGYLYKHNLELLGAIELCNARDLTDCGFNANKYTVNSLFTRLVKLSTFEFPYILALNNAIDGDKIVDYVKTFENYTLLSALREFFDGYNCAIKLEFNEDNSGNLTSGVFTLMSKTGNVNDGIIDDETNNVFNNVQELKTLDKASFGTSVISNAENVISTKAKTYPTNGIVKATGNAFKFGADVENSIVVRLPSNIYRVNYVELVKEDVKFTIISGDDGQVIQVKYNPCNDNSIINAYNSIKAKAYDLGIGSDFEENIKIETLKEYGKRRFYYEDNYDAISKKFISNNYIPIRRTWTNYDRQTVLSNSEIKSNVEDKNDVFYFERGKDTIEGFTFFGENPEAQDGSYNAVRFYAVNEGLVYTTWNNGTKYRFFIGDFTLMANGNISNTYQRFYLPNMGFVVNYIPMSDIKIKLDNSGTSRDTKPYNQNGKLTDSVSLSKSLLSYSKEIESDNITKYGTYYYEYRNGTINGYIPKVGSLVKLENKSDLYVINNVSLDFYPNEYNEGVNDSKLSYYIKGEFTLSKNIAVKSLMVNPNTNIRDYGIPQNFNVKRKQLYRDFYELDYTQDSNNTNWKLPLSSVLNLSSVYKPYQEHTAIMKLTFDGAYGGSPNTTWYYQLESTTFMLKKSIYEIIDFKDNNIIGYGSQNVWSGFDIRRLLGDTYDLTNTPISYVDLYGEVRGFELYFCTNEQVTTIYKDYMDSTGEDFSNSSYGAFYSCFIPSKVYGDNGDGTTNNYGALNSGKHDFKINEPNYFKDATEVPVFEYVCQIDDTNNVIVGSNILDTNDNDLAYLYSFVKVQKGKYNENNFPLENVEVIQISTGNIVTLNNACLLRYFGNTISVEIFDSVSYDLNTLGNPIYGTPIHFDKNSDYIIVRHRITKDSIYTTIKGELLSTQVYSSYPIVSGDEVGKIIVMNDDNYYYSYLDPLEGTQLETNNILTYAQFANLEGASGSTYKNGRYGVFEWVSGTYSEINSNEIYNQSSNMPQYPTHLGKYLIINNVPSSSFDIWDTSYAVKITFSYGDQQINSAYAEVRCVGANFTLNRGDSCILRGINLRDFDDIIVWADAGNETNLSFNFSIQIVDANDNPVGNYYFMSSPGGRIPAGQNRVIANQSGYYPDQWLYFRYPIFNSTCEYTYHLSGNYYDNRTLVDNGTIYKYGYKYYYYSNNTLTDYTSSIPTSGYRIGTRDNTGNWNSIRTLTNNEKGYVLPSSQYHWGGSSWVQDTRNTNWEVLGSASNQFFTYIGDLLKYDATTNTFNEYTYDDRGKKDLMFVFKYLEKNTNLTNELILYVNYYETH